MGRTLIQEKGSLGGSRNVFVKLQGKKNELVYPTFGAFLANPFKGAAKIFAGDLFEYRTDEKGLNPSVLLLKTFKVKSMDGTTVVIYKDGYKHIPFVGDILMKAPSVIGGKGKAYAVSAVTIGTDGNWQLTLNNALDSCVDGDILVEAKEAGASAEMLIKRINAVAPNDYDCYYEAASNPSATSDIEWYKARYALTPALGGLMYTEKMSPMPACVLAINKSNVNGWFAVDYCNRPVDNEEAIAADFKKVDDKFDILHQKGAEAPTTATVGVVGSQYVVTATGSEALYICTAVTAAVGETPASYTWVKVFEAQ